VGLSMKLRRLSLVKSNSVDLMVWGSQHHANRDRDGLLGRTTLCVIDPQNQLQIRSSLRLSKGSGSKKTAANFVFESASRRPGTPGQSLFSIQLITMGNYPPKHPCHAVMTDEVYDKIKADLHNGISPRTNLSSTSSLDPLCAN